MVLAMDPVATGFVDSLAKPGGNITGLNTLGPEMTRKTLQLLKDGCHEPHRRHVDRHGTRNHRVTAELLDRTAPAQLLF